MNQISFNPFTDMYGHNKTRLIAFSTSSVNWSYITGINKTAVSQPLRFLHCASPYIHIQVCKILNEYLNIKWFNFRKLNDIWLETKRIFYNQKQKKCETAKRKVFQKLITSKRKQKAMHQSNIRRNAFIFFLL